MDRLLVCVTGASGMVGYHVAKRMLAAGHAVVAYVRPSSKTAHLEQLSGPGELKITRGEITDCAALTAAFAGADIVVHSAGIVDPHATREQIVATNVGGTESALLAAQEASVRHFIHVSSLSVITGQHDQHGVNESAPLVYCGEAYADSKVDAEKAVIKFFGRSRMLVTILRPGFIYGPMERAWMPRLIQNLKTGKAMLIDGGIKQTNVIYVENLVSAIELAMLNLKANSQVFNLTDGEIVTKKQLFDAICDGLGYPRVTRRIPGFVARLVCEVVSTIAPHLPPGSRSNLSRFSRAAFRLAGLNQGFDISRAESELGYTNRIPFAQGMKATLEHFSERNSQSVKDPARASL